MTKPDSPTALSADIVWLHQLQQNDTQSLASMMEKYYRDLYNYAAKFTRSEDLIKDSIQEIFISLWQRRSTAANILALRPYLLRAVKNKVLKSLFTQQSATYPLDLPDEYEFSQEFSIEHTIIDRQLSEERILRLKQVLTQLSKRQHEVIYLKYYQRLDNNQIAELMDINRQSVYNLLHETLNKLRSIWPSASAPSSKKIFFLLYQ